MSRINTLIRTLNENYFSKYEDASICGGVHSMEFNVEDFVPCLSTPCMECVLAYRVKDVVGRISYE